MELENEKIFEKGMVMKLDGEKTIEPARQKERESSLTRIKGTVIKLEDEKIIELMYQKDERGLSALKSKYNRMILKVLRGILNSPQDAEECANDTLMAVWEKIPPDRPRNLTAYVCKIARRKAIDRVRYNTASVRNSDLLTELDECIPSGYSPESAAEKSELSWFISEWLKTLSDKHQRLFVLRYFYSESVKSAARSCRMTNTAATTALSRMRNSLKDYLSERGLF